MFGDGGYGYAAAGRRRRREHARIAAEWPSVPDVPCRVDVASVRHDHDTPVVVDDVDVIERERQRARDDREQEGYASEAGRHNAAMALEWAERLGIGYRRSTR